jgi:hypothetical protein
MAREAIKALVEEGKLRFNSEPHSKYSCYVKTASFVAPVSEKPAAEKKQPAKK